MSSIAVDGDIVGIVTEARFGFISYTSNVDNTLTTVIEPTGSSTSVYQLINAPGTTVGLFAFDFKIGDVVEAFTTDGASSVVSDSSNNPLFNGGGAGAYLAHRVRKIFSGTGRDWIVF